MDGKTNTAAEPAIKLRGSQKAAMLLILLGDQTSADILKNLPEEDVQTVAHEIAQIRKVAPGTADSVLEEFFQMSMARTYVVSGGVDYARTILTNAFGNENGRKLLDRLIKAIGTDMTHLDAIQKADPQQLAKFLHGEHPQTIALVLAHLTPGQAAAVLGSLPPAQHADLALRVANLDQISPEAINKIASIIGGKLKALGEFSRESYGGVRAVAEMFNRLETNASKEILAQIEAQDATLVETIRTLMFVFEDLLALDQSAIKELMARVDRKIPMLALKGTSEKMKNHFLQTLSERGAEMMREDMEALGAVKMKDVEGAQQELIGVLRQLEAEGVIKLGGGGTSEQYVV